MINFFNYSVSYRELIFKKFNNYYIFSMGNNYIIKCYY